MKEKPETHATQDVGSGTTGRPGTAYDPDSVGESGQRGVPTGDQHPTEERDDIKFGGGSVGISMPGGQTPGESRQPGTEPQDTQGGQSLGDLTGQMGQGKTRQDTGGLDSPAADEG